jgi:UDP-N-acetylglucosamine--dolichyl-phosphate N-acetylglucosaminephosphotransferase
MSSSKLTRTESLSIFALSIACFGVLANVFQGDGNPVAACLAFSGLAFSFSYCLIRWLGNTFLKAGFKGQDMSKLKKVEMCVDTPKIQAYEAC